MSVWFCIPSARANGGTAAEWKARGYMVALVRDTEEIIPAADLQVRLLPYPGYAESVNYLARQVLEMDPDAEWIVTGGDDTLPDQKHHPFDIGMECFGYFNGGTFGVMQPTGDRFADGSIDRIAGSPWIGREWCERANKGAGPLYPEFTHMFVDQGLMCAAERLGVYWRRPDLVHLHQHFMRESEALNSKAVRREPPPHLAKWNTPQHWNEMQAVFNRLKAQGFEPCLPLDA